MERLRKWIGEVGGAITIGESDLKSFKLSKSGGKITLVLKKKKPPKAGAADESSMRAVVG